MGCYEELTSEGFKRQNKDDALSLVLAQVPEGSYPSLSNNATT